MPYGIVEFYVIKRISSNICYFYHSNRDGVIIWTPKEDDAFLFDNEEQAKQFRRTTLAERDCVIYKILDYLIE